MFLAWIIATYAGIIASLSSSSPYSLPSTYKRMLLYHLNNPKINQIRSFGIVLEPRYIFGAGALDQ